MSLGHCVFQEDMIVFVFLLQNHLWWEWSLTVIHSPSSLLPVNLVWPMPAPPFSPPLHRPMRPWLAQVVSPSQSPLPPQLLLNHSHSGEGPIPTEWERGWQHENQHMALRVLHLIQAVVEWAVFQPHSQQWQDPFSPQKCLQCSCSSHHFGPSPRYNGSHLLIYNVHYLTVPVEIEGCFIAIALLRSKHILLNFC